MLLTLMSLNKMFGSSPTPPVPPTPENLADGRGGSSGDRYGREKVILDLIHQDEEEIMLVIMGFTRMNQFKNNYQWGVSII